MKRVMPRADGRVYYEDTEVGDVFMPTDAAPLGWWMVTKLFPRDDGGVRGDSRPLDQDEVRALILARIFTTDEDESIEATL